MTQIDTLFFGTGEAVRDYLDAHPGPNLVLAPETLGQIQRAEDAGGFEGGQSGGTDGGISREGYAGLSQTTLTDPAAGEVLDLDGAWRAGAFFEGATEITLGLRDVIEAIHGKITGPVLLVPARELRRLMRQEEPDDA